MKFQDYYEVLGISRDADAEQIRKAYRKLAMQWHPDRHSGAAAEDAEARFKKINEAYEVLSDPDKRKRYDRLGEHWQRGEEFQPPPGTRRMRPEEFEQAFGAGGFSEFFETFFGDQVRRKHGPGATHRRFRERGADLRGELAITVADAIAGGKRRFDIPVLRPCARCGGVGFADDHVCPSCAGVGKNRVRKTIDLTIPAQLRDGLTMRLKGLGEAGTDGGETGDFYLTLRLVADAVYRPDGADVEADVPVAPWEAELGAKVRVMTPGGPVQLSVPPRTAAGAKLRLRGRGLPDGRGGHGDFHAVIRLAMPEPPSERQRELLREMAEAGPGCVSGGARTEVKQR